MDAKATPNCPVSRWQILLLPHRSNRILWSLFFVIIIEASSLLTDNTESPTTHIDSGNLAFCHFSHKSSGCQVILHQVFSGTTHQLLTSIYPRLIAITCKKKRTIMSTHRTLIILVTLFLCQFYIQVLMYFTCTAIEVSEHHLLQ